MATPEEMDRSNVLDLLAAAAGVAAPASSAGRRFLEAALLKSEAVHIYVDGVDEVMPAYKDKALRLLDLLLEETKAARVWVASRPEVDNSLRHALHCTAVSLELLSHSQQLDYLRRKWTFPGEGHAPEAVDRLVNEVADSFASSPASEGKSSDRSDGGSLLGVPMNLRMAAEAFGDDARAALTAGKKLLGGHISQLDLLRRYIENNRKRCRQRYGIKSAIANLTNYVTAEDDVFQSLHQNCAMQIWTAASLPNYPQKFQKSGSQFQKYLTKEKTGILWLSEDAKVTFAHYMLVEYFVASWLFEQRTKDTVTKQYLIAAVDERKRGKVMFFLDLMLGEKQSLHKAIIGNKSDALAALLPEGKQDDLDLGGRSALHLAAAYGRAEAVDGLLEGGYDVSQRDSLLQWTPLQYADASLELEVAERLLGRGADRRQLKKIVDVAQGNFDVILEAAEFDLEQVMKTVLAIPARGEILKRKTNPIDGNIKALALNEDTSEASLPLQVAIRAGSTRVANLLSDHGMKCTFGERQDRNTNTATEEYGNTESTPTHGDILLQQETDNTSSIYEAASLGETNVPKSLSEKLTPGSESTQQTSQFPDYRVKSNFEDRQDNNTAKTEANTEHTSPNDDNLLQQKNNSKISTHDSSSLGETNVLKPLSEKPTLEAGGTREAGALSDFGKKSNTKEREDSIMKAVTNGEDNTENTSPQRDNILKQDSDSIISIHEAASLGETRVLKSLLEKLAPEAALEAINSSDDRQNTPLHYASRMGHLQVAELLLSRGADVLRKGTNGRTSIHVAAFNGHLEVLKLLVKKLDAKSRVTEVNSPSEEHFSPLHMASQEGHKDVVEFLLDNGASINAKNLDGNCPIHVASFCGREEVVEILLDRRAEVHSLGKMNYTPLHYAARQGHVKVANLLLSKGADVLKTGTDGRTSIHEAAFKGQLEALCLLIEKLPPSVVVQVINSPDHDHWTPLHLACWDGHKAIVECLLDKGAYINAKNVDGIMPVHVAASNGHEEVVALLSQPGADVRS